MIDKIDKINTTDSTKFVDWKNAPNYKDLSADLDAARPDHEKYITRLRKYRIDYNGGENVKALPNKSTAKSMLIRKQSEWRCPILEEPFLNTVDMFEVNPRTGEDEDGAIQNAQLANYQWNIKVDKVAIVTKMIRNYENEGTAIIKTGWNAEYKDELVDIEKPVYATPEESIMMLKHLVETGKMTQEQVIQFMKSGEPMQKSVEIVQETQNVLIENHITYEVKNNESIIVDPTCGDNLQAAGFIIDEYETNISELKKFEYKESEEGEESTGYYHNLDALKSMTNEESQYKEIHGEDKIENDFKYGDESRQKLTAYEYWGYWDIEDDKVLVPIVATWIGTVLIRLEKSPFPFNELPFDAAANLPLKNNWRGEPSGVLIVDNQEQIGRMTRAMNDMVSRNAVGQRFISDQFFPNRTEKDNYNNGRTTYYRHGMDPKRDIYRDQVDSIDNTTMSVIQFNEAQAESITGTRPFGNNTAGGSLGSNSATGVRAATDATTKRESSALRRLSGSLMVGIGRKTIMMNQAFLSEEQVIRITNKDYVTIKREDIQGEFDLIIDVSTPEKDNERAQDLGFIMQTNAASMDPALAKKVLGKIVRLKKDPTLADIIENHEDQPTPMEQQAHEMAMQEAQMKQKLLQMQILLQAKQIENYDANILEKTSRISENAKDTVEAQAHAELYLAQADKLKSETDQIDQDFVNQSDGLVDRGMTEAEKIAEARLDKIADREYEQQDKANDFQREIEKMHIENQLGGSKQLKQNTGVGQ